MSYLEIRQLTKRFKKETVLNRVSLAVEEGETVAVFGASGSGKTVLMRLIAGILRPDEGGIHVEGRRIDALDPGGPRHRHGLPELRPLPASDRLREYRQPAARPSCLGGRYRMPASARSPICLKIEHVLGHLPRELSNGQKQRCSLARALAPSPKLSAA